VCIHCKLKKWIVEVTISLMILCGGSHEGSLASYGILLKGFIRSRFARCIHTFLGNLPVVYGVMGLLCLISNHLVSLHIVSPGCGIVYVISVCAVGYDGYYSKGLALGLISFHGSVLYQHYLG
jgi:hypothetical protein